METPENIYIRQHSEKESESLFWVGKQTNIRTNYPRMLTGTVQGQFLKMMAKFINARRILEIGTFTGYSAICLADGLCSDENGNPGHVDTLEINDELEYIIRAGFKRAGVEDKITLHIGDALNTLEKFRTDILGSNYSEATTKITGNGKLYDMVYIDANKREYVDYYKLIIDIVRPGGCILADDVLWSGKLFQEKVPQDKQTRGIAKFNDTVANDPRVEVVILPVRHGLSLIRKR